MNDGDLLALAQNGSEEGFKKLYEVYASKVFNTAIGILADEKLAEDVVQDVFLQVFQSISEFKGNSTLFTWIYRITVNKSLNLERKKKMQGLLAKTFFWGNPEQQTSFHPSFGDEDQDNAKILHRALKRLPENQRIAITLSKLSGMKQDEVAQIMELSLSAVESLIHRGKKKLKELIEKDQRNG